MGAFGRDDDGEESRNAAAAALFGGQRTRPRLARNICVLAVPGLFAALSFAGLVSCRHALQFASDLVTGYFLFLESSSLVINKVISINVRL